MKSFVYNIIHYMHGLFEVLGYTNFDAYFEKLANIVDFILPQKRTQNDLT